MGVTEGRKGRSVVVCEGTTYESAMAAKEGREVMREEQVEEKKRVKGLI